MLPVENLDKKNYSEMVAEAIGNISRFTKEWTDFGSHDPGITMLEMMSWLSDMQRYYINRITDKNRMKYLNLYGVKLLDMQKSLSYVEFGCSNDCEMMPRGTKLRADEQVFETRESTMLTNNEIVRVVTKTELTETDNTHIATNKNISFYPFGKNMKNGNKLYIGFKKSIGTAQINIFFHVCDDSPVKINGTNEKEYKIAVCWKAYTGEGHWENVKIVSDQTLSFTQTGNIKISFDREMKPFDLMNDRVTAYYICAEITDSGMNLSPKIRIVSLNCIEAVNQNTLVEYKDFENLGDELMFEDNIFYQGRLLFQVNGESGWYDLEENECTVSRDDRLKCLYVKIPSQYKYVRIISYDQKTAFRDTVGASSGMPGQRFCYKTDKIVPEELVLQVGKSSDNGTIWNNYKYTRDFSLTKGSELCFMIDEKEKCIVFSDSENGMIPEKNPDNSDNIRIIQLVYSDCERGNVQEDEIKNIEEHSTEERGIWIKGAEKAVGGKKKMDINDGIIQVMKGITSSDRAVSLKDYEEMAIGTPGLRIAIAKAVQSFGKENKITVVTVPYTGSACPKLDGKMQRIIKNHLNHYRLITTEVDVVGPVYAAVSIAADIKVQSTDRFEQRKLEKMLMDYLTPLGDDYVSKEYEIGSKVLLSRIIKMINSFDNVKCVDYIRLDVSGDGAGRDKEGNIVLPYNGITFGENIELNIY